MIKIGLFGIGLDTYWAQFDGLLNNLKGYQEQIKNRIACFGVEVADAPGSAISALTEVACLIDETTYYQWLWPHIQRKLGYIDEMMNATDSVYKNFIGPLVHSLEENLKRR